MLGGLMPGDLVEIAAEDKPRKIGYINSKHGALEMFSKKEKGDLSIAGFKKWFRVVPVGAAEVLVRLVDDKMEGLKHEGDPLLLESGLPGEKSGRIMLFTSTVDREWNNFPVRPLYLPLLQQLISYLAENVQSKGAGDSIKIGEPLRIPLTPEALPVSAIITMPDRQEKEITPVRSKLFTGIEYEAEKPGIYSVEWSFKGRKRRELIACNPETGTGEPDLEKIKVKDINGLLPGTPVIVISDIQNLEEGIMSILHGKEASRPMLLVLLLILILEVLVANWRKHEK